MAAARRKSGALHWGDLSWESGAKTHRKVIGDCPPSSPLVAFRHSPGRPPPKQILAAPSRCALLAHRRQHAAGSTGCACRWICVANAARSAQMGTCKLS
jgi:hypothetical protein